MRIRTLSVVVAVTAVLGPACSSGGSGKTTTPDAPTAPGAATGTDRHYAVTPLDPDPAGAGPNWGERLREAPDLNGDGAPEIVVGHGAFSSSCCPSEGRVSVVSGKDRSVLYTLSPPTPSPQASFGTNVSVFTGPSGPAVLVGTKEPVEGRKAQGRAYAFSLGAAAATPLFTLDDPVPEAGARFGDRLGRAGDVAGHGNGTTDVIVGAQGHQSPPGCASQPSPSVATCRTNVGKAYVFNGATGALLRTLDMPASDVTADGSRCNRAGSCGSFGSAVQSPGDVDGDGKADQLVSAYGFDAPTGPGAACARPEPNDCNEEQGRQYLFSGGDGSLLATIDDPEPQPGAKFGFQDVAPDSPGDVNGDKVPDLYANGFEQDGPQGKSQGGAWVFDGKKTLEQHKGVVLYKLTGPRPSAGGQFGWSMSRTDFEPDGKPDLFVGSAPHHLIPAPGAEWPDQRGYTAVLNGADGTTLKLLELPPSMAEHGAEGNLGSNLGWSVAAPGDLDGDKKPDYVAGAPYSDIGTSQDQGRIVFFLSG